MFGLWSLCFKLERTEIWLTVERLALKTRNHSWSTSPCLIRDAWGRLEEWLQVGKGTFLGRILSVLWRFLAGAQYWNCKLKSRYTAFLQNSIGWRENNSWEMGRGRTLYQKALYLPQCIKCTLWSAVLATVYQMHTLKHCSRHKVSDVSSEGGGTHHKMSWLLVLVFLTISGMKET